MTVSRWVSNKSQPTVETLYEIASALDMEAKDLLSPVNDIVKKRMKSSELYEIQDLPSFLRHFWALKKKCSELHD